MRDDGMNCEGLQRALREGSGLTDSESAHIDRCDACMEVWLMAALDEKPEVEIPEDFAVHVAAQLPPRSPRRSVSRRPRNWGLAIAMVVVTALMVAFFVEPAAANSWVRIVFPMMVATEIASLALWLGPRWTGR
jgi:hypothetical protein